MQICRGWFIDFLAEMVGKYASAENAGCELGDVEDEAERSVDEGEKGGVAL